MGDFMKNIIYSLEKSIAVFGLIIFCSSVSKAEESTAGLFIEPAITYETSDALVNYPSPFANTEGTLNGFGLGARVGFHVQSALFLGVDGRYSMPQYKDTHVSYDAKSKSTNWGPVIGIQMPNFGLRIWGTYILGGQLDPDRSGNLNVKFESAAGYRVGVGFRIAVFSANLEYQSLKYDRTNLEQIGPFTSGSQFSNVNLENKSWIASLSFPLQL
jgi:hypothetical protein